MKAKQISPRQQAYCMIALQAGMVTLVAFFWLLTGWVASVSAILGGLSAVLPSFYFAYRFFAVTYARQVDRILRAFYWGEVTKLLLSAFLVILISKLWPEVAIFPLFSGFAAAWLSFWLTPLVTHN
jgi:ATP synthase protein I